jgi:hypothetical protein
VKKLVAILVIVVGTTMLTPAVASASTPSLASLAKTVAALKKQVNTQAATIKSLKTKLKSVIAMAPYLTVTQTTLDGVKGPNIVFHGVNMHIRSATGETDTSGLGNLIVGWNEPWVSPPDGYRGGSNNLVCGDMNSFTSAGCFVAGENNTVGQLCNSVSGGYGNVANGWFFASVSGGIGNHAGGSCSSISGGNGITQNTTDGWSAGSYHTP